MIKELDFAVIGADRRLDYAADELRRRGFGAVRYAEGAIPIGAKHYLFAPPFSAAKLQYAGFASEGTTVFAGAISAEAKALLSSSGARIINYCETEYFNSENAELTAEAAMTVYIGASGASFRRAKVLISGFGRIGKALAFRLRSHGADVTASARKIADIELIRVYGCKPMETAAIRGEYDVIFNTIPANVFTKDLTDRTKTDYYIELASAPYGVADKNIWSAGTKVIMAGGLPGKVLPVTAGRLIAETVCTLL